ncbi:Ted1p SCDLUD_000376 [Saccharomycodes ludwigii]|uniref:Ted1p n=1 Tax=Saccharomycodes ludwigii TaxID=36035 RepID=UPI001E83DFD3|nr:hypothetical protein SCDLUD_000376 [Saccharomycodes ludwigii]KAH3902785.1 hypothetical protein SCDLUD_000376 [Saccharomycodes ludwigii]
MACKKFLKIIAVINILLALFTNIYIHLYPSLSPIACSWWEPNYNSEKCKAPQHFNTTYDRISFTFNKLIQDINKHYFQPSDANLGNGIKDKSGKREDIHLLAFGDPQINGVWPSTKYRSRLDMFGNDYYLGHIYATMTKRLRPSHVVVMGDLFSSQWIGDYEFYKRTMRYVKRLFPNSITNKVDELKMLVSKEHDEEGHYKTDWDKFAKNIFLTQKNHLIDAEDTLVDHFKFGYENVYKWNENDTFLFLNMTGNHDIGYGGDATWQHMSRWHDIFGHDNFYIEYEKQTDHPWRIVSVNSMLLDGPPLEDTFRDITWEFLYQVFERNFNGSTILLTHIPLAKKEGLCVDGPFFKYYPNEYEDEPYKSGLLRSQNHLSQETTDKLLNLVFHNGKPGIILTGHDHEGCETYYNMYRSKKRDDPENIASVRWTCEKEIDPKSDYHIKEVTVKSMMGHYGGNTGLVTGHFDGENWQWYYTVCPFTVQHIWWISKISLILAGFFVSLLIVV